MSLIYVDLSEQLEAARDGLPPGVSVGLSVTHSAVYLQYSARIMVRGKRISVGTFLDRDACIQAVIDAKYGKTEVRSIAAGEATARTELSMLSAGKLAEVAKPRDMLTMERIQELLRIKGMLDWQVTAEADIDVMDSDGKMYTISKEQQSKYNNWVHGIDSGSKAEPVVLLTKEEKAYQDELMRLKEVDPVEYARLMSEDQQAVPAVMDQVANHVETQQPMTDEEYDRMMFPEDYNEDGSKKLST